MSSNKRKRRPRSIGEWFNGLTESFEYMFHQFASGVGQVFTGIGALIFPRRLMDKLRKRSSERAARSVTTESKMGKSVEKLEDRFQGAMQGVGSTLNDLYKLFVPTKLIESTEKAVSAKTKSIFGRISRRFGKIVDRFTPKWVKTILTKLNDRFSFITKFTGAWAKSRNYMALAWSLPAFLFLIPIMASFVGSVVYSSEDKKHYYNAQLATAIEDRNASAEKLCYDKLEQLGWEHLDLSGFTAAVAKAEEGNWEEAIAEMEAIAPLEHPGLPPAHLWLASKLAEGKYEVADPWATFETHARHARAMSVGRYRGMRASAERFIVETDLHYGRVDEAIELMQELVRDFPELHGHLMEQFTMRRDFIKAQFHARSVADRFESLGDATGLSPRDFNHWALACRLLGKNKVLLDVLAKAREVHGENEQLQMDLDRQFAQRLVDMSFRESGLLELLKKALDIDPQHPQVVAKLVQGMRNRDPMAKTCVDSLEECGKLPMEVFYKLGDDAIGANDGATAATYYQRVCKLYPKEMRAWNNLAHILSHFEPTNYEMALKAIEKAMELEKDTRISETKGQILCKMGRWEDAIPFLEQGLNGTLIDAFPTHAALAEAYERTGNAESAAAHRERAGGVTWKN